MTDPDSGPAPGDLSLEPPSSGSDEQSLVRGVLLGLFISVAVAIAALQGFFRLRDDGRWIAQTQESIGAMERVRALAADLESAARGYALTGDAALLAPFDAASRTLDKATARLSSLVAGRPEQLRRTEDLAAHLRQCLEREGRLVEARRRGGYEAARVLVASEEGHRQHAAIRDLVDVMEDAERAWLKARLAHADVRARRAFVAIFLSSLLPVGLAGFGFYAIRRDLAGSRRAQAALRSANASLDRQIGLRTAELAESRELLGRIIDNAPAAVFAMDRRHRFTLSNRANLLICRVEEADLLGRTEREIFPPETAEALWASNEAVMATGWARQSEETMVLGDGSRIAGIVTKFPLRNAQGEVVGLAGMALDMSAQRWAEEALLASEEQLRLALEAARMGTFDWDIPADRMLWSRQNERLYGFEPGGFDGTFASFASRVHPDDLPGVEAEIARCIGAREPLACDYRVLWPDGSLHWIAARGEIAFGEQGQALRVRGTAQDITERMEAQMELTGYRERLEELVAVRTAELKASEAKLRTIYDLLPVGISITDRSGTIVDCNPASERLLGIARADRPGPDDAGRAWSLVRPDGTPMPLQERADVRAMAEGRTVRDVEMGAARPEGTTWISVSATPSTHPDYGVVIAYADITARRRAEDALRESERRWQFALEGPGGGVWDWNVATGEVLFSKGWKAMLGFAEEEIADRLEEWERRVHPEDLPRVLADLKAHLEGATPMYLNEHRVLCKDGRWKWILDRGLVMIRDPDGKPVRAIGTQTDIAERKQAELELQASEAKARAIVDASPVPLAISHRERDIVYLNPAFVETFGYTLDDMPTMDGWRLLAYPDPEYRDRVVQARRHYLARAGAEERDCAPLELAVRCKDGSQRSVIARATPLADFWEGFHVNTFYDVTDLKQAREQAEQAARIKSEFLANMSHEIRTPMNAMLGLAQVLEREGLSPDQRRLVAGIRTAGASLLEILNDILDFSKIEAGQLRVERRPFALAPILAQIQGLMGAAAQEKGLGFVVEAPDGVGDRLIGDPLRLEQVLANLVGNAVKFTEEGEVRVRARTLAQDQASVRLRFEVQDTGIGIAPEQSAALGTPFTQADGTITRRFGGSGLGLSISKQLVGLMGGTLGFESELGQGSTFWFELPLERASGEPAAPPAAQPPARASGPGLSGLRCLVVEDSPANRDVVGRILKREGALVTLAADGRQAVDCLSARPDGFDAVLMDIQMPVLDGLAATRAIRGGLGLATLPVIACSAGVLAEQRAEALAAGANDFVAKPLDLDELIGVLRRWARPGCAPGERTGPSTEGRAATASAGPPGRPGAADACAPADFPSIPGLDIRRAALLLEGDRAFFLSLLRRFGAELGTAAQDTRADLARGDAVAAARRLHGLRGIAGNIGALGLVQSAQALEVALGDRGRDRTPLLDDFEARLAALLQAISPWLDAGEEAEAADGGVPIDPARLCALSTALARRDLAALDLFARLRPALARCAGQPAVLALAEAIDALRFDDALAQLELVSAVDEKRLEKDVR